MQYNSGSKRIENYFRSKIFRELKLLRGKNFRVKTSVKQPVLLFSRMLPKSNPLIHNVPKVVRHNFKILQHLLKDFSCVSELLGN